MKKGVRVLGAVVEVFGRGDSDFNKKDCDVSCAEKIRKELLWQ